MLLRGLQWSFAFDAGVMLLCSVLALFLNTVNNKHGDDALLRRDINSSRSGGGGGNSSVQSNNNNSNRAAAGVLDEEHLIS